MPNRTTATRPIAAALLAGLVGALLLYLAWPRLHASLLYLPVDTAIGNYWETREIPLQQLRGLQQRAREVIGVQPHHRYWDGLSLLYYIEGLDPRARLYERRMAMERSAETATASLLRAPAQPAAWWRLAAARSWLQYPAEGVLQPLSMAIYTGRVDPVLFIPRLQLGLAHVAEMDDEVRRLFRDQLLLAWELQREEVIRALRSGVLRVEGIEPLLEPGDTDILRDIREAAGAAVP